MGCGISGVWSDAGGLIVNAYTRVLLILLNAVITPFRLSE